jgi:hypothetical protein
VLSITECKKKLNKNGVSYTDEEVKLIREVLYKFAEVYYKNKIENK